MKKQPYAELIESLKECIDACNRCFDACLNEENVKMMADCIRLDRECADVCSFLEQAITRHSPFVEELINLCAVICQACGDECRKHTHDHCQKCADVCLMCADACRKAV